ncbi:MAG: histidine kinase, partial [Gammaproteobacteria bacterium]|nr:histidine kinase [Gammaproteobacteria bacterium]
MARYALVTAAGWILLSLLSAPGFYLDRALAGETPHVDLAIGAALLACLGWALCALLLLMFSARLRRRRLHGIAWFAAQLAFGVVLILVMLTLMRWWGWSVLGLARVLRTPDFLEALAVGWPRGLAIYAALWCVCQLGLLWRAHTRLKAQLVSAELWRLRTQLNPHFLFNTLNAISELGYT